MSLYHFSSDALEQFAKLKDLLKTKDITLMIPRQVHDEVWRNRDKRRLRNVSRLGFHAFRHSYVSMLINSGVNPLVVRDLVGHTTVDMTARYTHVALDTKINAVKSLPIFTQPESPVQTNLLSAIITDLQTKDLIRLETFLENILTEEQKRELIQKLQ